MVRVWFLPSFSAVISMSGWCTLLLLFFLSPLFFCLRCTRSRNNTILWAIKQGIIRMAYIWFWKPHLFKCVTNWFKCDRGAFVSAAKRFLPSVYNAGGVGVSLCEPDWAALILPSSRALSRAAPLHHHYTNSDGTFLLNINKKKVIPGRMFPLMSSGTSSLHACGDICKRVPQIEFSMYQSS